MYKSGRSHVSRDVLFSANILFPDGCLHAHLEQGIMFKQPKFNWFGRGFKLRAAITIACQLAFVLFGYDQGVFSGIVGNQHFLDTFDHPSPGLEGIIVSIYNLGCFTGCILAFIFCEKTGRRLAMWIAMCFIIVSTHSHNQLIVGIGRCNANMNRRSAQPYKHRHTPSPI